MPKEERKSGSCGVSMAPKLKLEQDKDLERALRLSKDQHLREQKRMTVKDEPRISVKTELHTTKTEPRANVKAELPSTAVKREQCGIKAESGSATGVKAEQRDEPLPSLKAKIEQLRKVKGELKTKMENDCSVDDLVRRGLELRAQAQKKVKREPGKKRSGIKIKKERSRNANGLMRKKPRITQKTRAVRREIMARELPLSEELAELLGVSEASRPDIVRRLWAYCRDNGMLNPENKREIQFDAKLQQMMGSSSASMPQLISLVNPHIDYVKGEQIKAEAKQEVKTETGQKVKFESSAKRACKGEQRDPVKHEVKTERKDPFKLLAAKREKLTRALASPQRAKTESTTIGQRAKIEPTTVGRSAEVQSAAQEALRVIVPRITKFDATSSVVQFTAPPGCADFEAVAVPAPGSSDGSRRAPCVAEFREDGDGSLALHVESRLENLNPEVAYQISVQTLGGAACSLEAGLPQRARPKAWSQREVEIWCGSQQVPELLQMVQKYGIDGQTLLSLGEEDLRQSGLVVPFLLRRVVAGLDALRDDCFLA